MAVDKGYQKIVEMLAEAEAVKWEIQMTDSKILRKLSVSTIAEVLKKGWLSPDDMARRSDGTQQPWQPIRKVLGKTLVNLDFDLGAAINPPRAYAKLYTPYGTAALAIIALIGFLLNVGSTQFHLDLGRAILLSIGIAILIAAVFIFINTQMPWKLIGILVVAFVGFPILGSLTGIHPGTLLRHFLNFFSLLTMILTVVLGAVSGYLLGYVVGWIVGLFRRDRYSLPATRQPIPEALIKT